ncbi:hypothetical protein OC842_006130 [Tilletia horrida]|uniref:Uncharacterized protein n=1 Tax=Tilletia horrida TaxID=155126 RepID=A0AAN6G929_9BASI|nr:hypothetical protein OC842_006130 [Tilletia horrida]
MTEEDRQREERIKQARREAEEKEAEVRAQRLREERKEKKQQEKEASRAAKKSEQDAKNAPWRTLSEHERQAILQAKATIRNGQKKACKRLTALVVAAQGDIHRPTILNNHIYASYLRWFGPVSSDDH